jgi:hypothetical protein
MRCRFRWSGLLAVLVAVAAQLGFAAAAPIASGGASVAGGGWDFPLCRGDATPRVPGPKGHSSNACLVCPFCAVLHAVVVLPPGTPALARPARWTLFDTSLIPDARGPPRLARARMQARAPPIAA